MAYHVTQEKMEELARNELTTRVKNGGEICAMLILEYVDCNADKGELNLKHVVQEAASNPAGNMHGGVISWLMDSAMGILSRSYTGYEHTVTMDIHVSFLRAINVGDEVLITSRITHSGRQIINVCAEAIINGRISATADAIFLRIS